MQQETYSVSLREEDTDRNTVYTRLFPEEDVMFYPVIERLEQTLLEKYSSLLSSLPLGSSWSSFTLNPLFHLSLLLLYVSLSSWLFSLFSPSHVSWSWESSRFRSARLHLDEQKDVEEDTWNQRHKFFLFLFDSVSHPLPLHDSLYFVSICLHPSRFLFSFSFRLTHKSVIVLRLFFFRDEKESVYLVLLRF